MFIDTHLHLIDRARLSYPWLADVPALDRDWRYEEYAAAAGPLGITGALHMEVDVAPNDIDAETGVVRDLMAAHDSLILGAISAARPEEPDFAAWLDEIDRAVVRGLRRVLHVMPDDLSQSARFRDSIRRLGPAGLPFDICVLARQLPLAAALVDKAPDVTFVLDHCGVPDIAGGGFDIWAADITELARRPNLNAKISGVTAYGDANWSAQSLRPYIEHVVKAFGWDRVVWGSDSPVCTILGSLEAWVAATHALFEGCTEEERAKLYRNNAQRIWGI